MSDFEKAKLNIGGLALPYGLAVAPMAGISAQRHESICQCSTPAIEKKRVDRSTVPANPQQ